MTHTYSTRVVWTGSRGEGTSHYRAYDRMWDIAAPGKDIIHCSNDPLLGGDPARMNPEDLLLSALSGCHMLWYLHYAADAGITVLSYEDSPIGEGETGPGGAGRFLHAVLRPSIAVKAGTDLKLAEEIHHRIHAVCFVARSVNFPVRYEPTFSIAS